MRSIVFGVSAVALSLSGTSVAATSKPAHGKPTTKAESKAVPKVPDMATMFAMFDKLFPPQPDPEPARLALARTSAASIWPTGAYGSMMMGMMNPVVDRVLAMKPSDLPPGMNVGPSVKRDISLHDSMAAGDPNFDARLAAIRGVVTEEAAQFSDLIDPRIRDGLARSMARRFDQRQLTDINAFFATPSGHALASQYMQMFVDPDVMRGMMNTMPQMMTLMPDAMQKIKAVNDKYPEPPKPAADKYKG